MLRNPGNVEEGRVSGNCWKEEEARRGEKLNVEKSRVTMLRFVGRTGRGESEAGKERLV